MNALAAPVFDDSGQIQFVITLIGAATILDTSEDTPSPPARDRGGAPAEARSRRPPGV